jgi:hypothetical protein
MASRRKKSPAVIFLWIVAILTMIFIAGAIGYRLFERQLMRWVMVPSSPFRDVPMPAGADYRQARMWIARPDIAGNPSLWVPPGFQPPPAGTGTGMRGASVFFVHPTSFLESSAWNAPVTDPESQDRAALFVRSQASAFNSVGQIWAPRYRQAAFGAFLTSEADARRALDFAYRDVLAAYEEFLREAPADRPIILAAHSQGSAHLMRLLQERIKGAPEARRVVAAYLIGWPVSVGVDLPALPFPACERPGQAACILSWQSFSEPADPSQITDVYDESIGPGGARRAGTAMLCTNPLTGGRGGAAPAARNLGTLVPNAAMSAAEFRRGAVAARCDARGFLLIGDNGTLPAMGPYALPGNNYHVYDYALFWANIRADAERRLAAFEGPRR